MPILSFAHIKKIILFGGGDRLTACCSLARPHFDLLVITSGRHLEERLENGISLREFLKQNNLRYLDGRDPEDQAVVSEIDADTLGLSLGAPWIFRQDFIDRFEGRLLNLHSTPLPRHRGGGGYSWMIMMRERRSASLLHQITPKVDAGPVVMALAYDFPQNARTPADYLHYAKVRDLELLQGLFACCREGRSLEIRPQDEAQATYFPRLHTATHGFVDWTWPASEIASFICAFDEPYEGASTFLGAELVRLKKCRLAEEQAFHPFQAGLIYRVDRREIFIAARGGGLALGQVWNAEDRDVTAGLRTGIRFHTPEARLQQARTSQALYTPQGVKVSKL